MKIILDNGDHVTLKYGHVLPEGTKVVACEFSHADLMAAGGQSRQLHEMDVTPGTEQAGATLFRYARRAHVQRSLS